MNISKKEIDALVKCAENVNYFSKYVQIITAKGRSKFKPYSYQRKLLKKIMDSYNSPQEEKHNNIIVAPRQIGKTTLLAIYALWFALFKPDKFIAIMSFKHAASKEILMRIKDIYNTLPDFLKLQPKINNVEMLGFVNGSKIFAAPFKSNSIKGRSIDLLIFDEAAFTNDNDFKDFLWSVFPTQAARPDAQMIMCSTPHGTEHGFYEIWKKSLAGQNSFIPTKLKWNCVPYRTAEWKKKKMLEYGEMFFKQELDAEFITSKSL